MTKNWSLEPRLEALMYCGITRFVPDIISNDELEILVNNFVTAFCIGTNGSFKLEFSRRDDLTTVILNVVFIEYNWSKIEEQLALSSNLAIFINLKLMVIFLLLVKLMFSALIVHKRDI